MKSEPLSSPIMITIILYWDFLEAPTRERPPLALGSERTDYDERVPDLGSYDKRGIFFLFWYSQTGFTYSHSECHFLSVTHGLKSKQR